MNMNKLTLPYDKVNVIIVFVRLDPMFIFIYDGSNEGFIYYKEQ